MHCLKILQLNLWSRISNRIAKVCCLQLSTLQFAFHLLGFHGPPSIPYVHPPVSMHTTLLLDNNTCTGFWSIYKLWEMKTIWTRGISACWRKNSKNWFLCWFEHAWYIHELFLYIVIMRICQKSWWMIEDIPGQSLTRTVLSEFNIHIPYGIVFFLRAKMKRTRSEDASPCLHAIRNLN